MSAPVAISKAKKASKPTVPAAHPPYASMITDAIKKLGDKKGSSRQAIVKYIVENNKVDATKAAVRINLALKKLITSKKLVAAAVAGKKGSGSFKLPAKEVKALTPLEKKPTVKKTKPTKKPTAKKSKKTTEKKDDKPETVKKTTVKKSAEKKPTAKKTAAKKPDAKKATKA